MPLPPLSPGAMVSEMAVDPLGVSVIVLGAVGYGVGVRRLADRGRAWPVGRSVAFAGALLAFAVATLSGLAAYDTIQFSAHMAQHLLLGMAVPVLLVVARPVTLILQAGSRPTQVTTLRVLLHNPVVAFLTRPLVAFVAFVSTLWLLYFTPLYDLSARNDALHLGLHVHFVVVGVLFYGAVLATDPRPHEAPPATRLGLSFLALPAHAFLGMALLAGTAIIGHDAHVSGRQPWQGDALADQRLAAGLLLSVGEIVGLAVVLAIVWSWMAADGRAADREARAGGWETP
ncbi:MAG TPA: cytochrome c oxidase assembly protein [Acidimicrobiales bacterium]